MKTVEMAGGPAGTGQFRCGSLLYTKAGLFQLFAWLLWGDFCFSLMEAVFPSILPLVLKADGASNTLISLFMTSVPSIMNFVLNPIISTASDRYRSRRGRRLPFLLWATPFVSGFLVLLACIHPISEAVHGWLAHTSPNLSAGAVLLGVLCVLIVGFRFFELVVNTIFWYLFNDVVPEPVMGRFLGMFRVVGSLAGALYSYFLLQYAESHTSWLFLGTALFYGAIFMAMGLNIKEGEYPPPTPISSQHGDFLAYVKTFFRESFSHRLYWLVFAYTAVLGLHGAIGIFMLLMAKSFGLTLGDVGHIGGIAAFTGTLLMYPMGMLIDRFHPLRVMIGAQLGYSLCAALYLPFLFADFDKQTAFWIYAAAVGCMLPFGVANAAAALPMVMRLFPKDKFGQFCSANAMCGSLGAILGGAIAGPYLDLIRSHFGNGNNCYRFIPLWIIFFMLLATALTYLVFREWKRLGGDQNYVPPAPDLPGESSATAELREA